MNVLQTAYLIDRGEPQFPKGWTFSSDGWESARSIDRKFIYLPIFNL
jgi:hypothetical protein